MKMTVYERASGELYVAPDGEGGVDKPVKVVSMDTSGGVTSANASIDSALGDYSHDGYYPRLRVLCVSPLCWAAIVGTSEPPAGWWEEEEVP